METVVEFAPLQPLDITVARLGDWLLREGRMMADIRHLIAGLGARLNAASIPVDRLDFAAQALHAEHVAYSGTWIRGEEGLQQLQSYGLEEAAGYQNSTFRVVHETREPLFLWLPDTPDDSYILIDDLKRDGYRHYACFPVFFANGHMNAVSLATRDPEGFSARALAVIEALIPTLVAVLEILSSYKSLDEVLRIYVGNEPHHAILAGHIGRGQVSRIRSAILFADMRNYTRITSAMDPEEAVALLNRYFDCLVPPIESQGGEVLKYMGDGLLAIFRDRGDDTGAAAQSALAAAIEALARISRIDARAFHAPIQAGIALHHGEAAYGNVGSGARLDFTVVGRDVNLTSRLAQLNKTLGEPLVMSRRFSEHLWVDAHHLGAFRLDGFDDEVDVYRP